KCKFSASMESVTGWHGSLARTRRQISRVSRTELEDGFLRLHDENLLLREFAQKQEDRIKRMGTKLSRLSHERAQGSGRPASWWQRSGRNLVLEGDLEETQERVWELEKRNEGLRKHVLFYKQQLELQGCGRHCPYSYVSPRVDTGLRRAHTATGRVPERVRKGKGGPRVAVSMTEKETGPKTTGYISVKLFLPAVKSCKRLTWKTRTKALKCM
uniref:Uncharacterized protein n=1 Tax=Varanus komodoensis TaxID=61221 RepID=A0A8D2LI36_VARKO